MKEKSPYVRKKDKEKDLQQNNRNSHAQENISRIEKKRTAKVVEYISLPNSYSDSYCVDNKCSENKKELFHNRDV